MSLPKAVEEFLEKLRNDPKFRDVLGDVVDATTYHLLTHPDSPIKKLIEAADSVASHRLAPGNYGEFYKKQEQLKQRLAALKEE